MSGLLRNAWLSIGVSVLLGAVLVVLLLPPPAGSESEDELVFLCAAGLARPVEEARQTFEESHGIRINVSFDGSGALLGKVRKLDQPGDLFLAAERSYIDSARRERLVEEVFPVARMTPVIAVAPGNPRNVQSLDDLLRGDVRVSLPDPDAAAVGNVVRRALTEGGRWAEFRRRIRDGSVSLQGTVNKSALDARLGVVDAALVWDATARQTGLAFVHDPLLDGHLEQVTLGILASSRHPTAALRFARFLTARDTGQPLLLRHHFDPIPDADAWAWQPRLRVLSTVPVNERLAGRLARFAAREGVELDTDRGACDRLREVPDSDLPELLLTEAACLEPLHGRFAAVGTLAGEFVPQDGRGQSVAVRTGTAHVRLARRLAEALAASP